MKMRALCLIYSAACNPDFKKESFINNYEVECDHCGKRAFKQGSHPYVSWKGDVFCNKRCVLKAEMSSESRKEDIHDMELVPLWEKIKKLRQCGYLDPNLIV